MPKRYTSHLRNLFDNPEGARACGRRSAKRNAGPGSCYAEYLKTRVDYQDGRILDAVCGGGEP